MSQILLQILLRRIFTRIIREVINDAKMEMENALSNGGEDDAMK